MKPRSARRRRVPRVLLLLALLLLLLPLAPVDWAGALRFFQGGSDAGPGGGASVSESSAAATSGASFAWADSLPRLSERARAGEAVADQARVGERWRALATAVESAATARDLGGARRTLAAARASWLKDVPACAAAAEELSTELERAAEAHRRSELAATEAALQSGDTSAARSRWEALGTTGDEFAFEDLGRLARQVRGADPAQSNEERAREQALLWRRGAAGQPGEQVLRQGVGLALRAETAAEVGAALRLAHELARCVYPARRVADDLDGAGLELRWTGSSEAGSAALRERGGVFELRIPGAESFAPLRSLEEPELVHVAVETFAALGLGDDDARVALAILLARSGEREAALRLLAARPALEDEERLRFLAAIGG
ncbi:MAG: hypothetical protein IPN34_02140 [Planctomycetes bacterium]|nr:hypothetical protein [Planctomycetota bacterium]